MKDQEGQVVLTLILIMTVALAIGISVVQRSISDVSTASKVEQSSRAFSAAEAGIESSLAFPSQGGTISLPNEAQASIKDTGWSIPETRSTEQQKALRFPFLSREETAQVWLADPTSSNLPDCDTNKNCYSQDTLDVYWGELGSDPPALELTLIYHESGQYTSRKWYLDSVVSRTPTNRFTLAACGGYEVETDVGKDDYQCKYTLGNGSSDASDVNRPLPASLMLLRARLLYNNTPQSFAVQARDNCGRLCSLPPQKRVISSVGTAGSTQRHLWLEQTKNMVPPYLDYAIFSVGKIEK